MSVEMSWLAAATIGLWLGEALLFTSMGRRDQKAWPISRGETVVAWLVVCSPTLVLVPAIVLGANLPIWAGFVAGLVGSSLSYKFGKKLPAVGRWISVLEQRQEERARKGVL